MRKRTAFILATASVGFAVGLILLSSTAKSDTTVWKCLNEDGSGQAPNQYPCVWLGGANGQGAHLMYLGPDSNPIRMGGTESTVTVPTTVTATSSITVPTTVHDGAEASAARPIPGQNATITRTVTQPPVTVTKTAPAEQSEAQNRPPRPSPTW